ncbi:UDP-2,3-diacylglucosamine diphosphatase [Flavihumibacter rivuli]|uniref:UDP-2,3-diacylglucosamine diphosphatase n=1 Tax=Flavihumibacter rivuli TaxID=2838156 RepID=UPI001BDF00A6|nr:UDP-2,3-diacylglucosamine diphosphatase [Flavihumibacter rivuli]ULQ55120.1 UDP-2,3-diacylglucosamine diphosphatase [Flavihumibacter rivuli]
MQLEPGKKIYFLSDFHLGAPDHRRSLEREKRIVRFLEAAEKDAAMFFVVGDMFDFWYEYKSVVPKGYVRLLGKLASITDKGIPVHFFVGNHDMWMRGYFEQELNIPVFFTEVPYEINGKQFLVGHGDGLGPGDHGYKFIKKIFRNPVCQWLFGILHPTMGIGLANYLSRKSRAATGQADEVFLGEDNEWLITYCKDVLKSKHYDYFVFGHRHLPIDFDLPGNSRYINLGDWLKYNTYAVFDGTDMKLETFHS